MGKQGIPHVTCEHLLKLEVDGSKNKEKEHVVLDLRDTIEFESGHIEGSVNIPRKELEDNIHTLIPDKKSRVIVIVGPTHEEEIEAIHEELKGMGYGSLEFLAGGFDKYCEIAEIDVAGLDESTPEEAGAVGDELTEIDPEGHDNEPIY
jgi:rhodanese-related sulfurtransferase